MQKVIDQCKPRALVSHMNQMMKMVSSKLPLNCEIATQKSVFVNATELLEIYRTAPFLLLLLSKFFTGKEK